MSRLVVAAGFALVSVSGCGGSAGDPPDSSPAFTSTDSAGVELAVTTFSKPARPTGWTIGAEPLVVFGESGDELAEFVWIRNATRLSDGRVVALDGRANELMIFAPTGELLARVGRAGDGPGEFRRTAGLATLGSDTILVYDSNHQRFSFYDSHGDFIEDRRLETPDDPGEVPRLRIYGLADVSGDAVTMIGQGYIFSTRITGDHVIENPTLRYRLDGSFLDEVAEPAMFWFYRSSDGSTGKMFGGRQGVAAGGGRVYVNDRVDYEVRVFDPVSGLIQVLRLDRQKRPVTEDDVARYKDRRAQMARDPEQRRRTLERIDRMPIADSLPWIARFKIDVLGYIWVTEYQVTDDDPSTTSVFSADGPWLGTVEVPDALVLLDIGEDYVLANVRDELDVQHLMLFELTR